MKFNKFLQTGLISLLLVSSIGSALGQPINAILDGGPVDNVAITYLVKNKISKDDLAFLASNIDIKTDKSEAIYKKIDSLVNQHAKNDMKVLKTNIDKTLADLKIYKDVKVSYKHAIPFEVMKDFKGQPGVKDNDSSVAYNLYNEAAKCDVSLKLASDNHGRLFEASELSHLTTQEVSKMSQAEINSVLKETVLHEASHCLMHSELKKTDFQLNFSEKTLAQSPEMAKMMSKKIIMVKESLKNGQAVESLDMIAFVNFNEGFADVMSAFARMGEKPTTSSIKEAKDQLLNVSHMREESGMSHKTQPAIQNALSKLDQAAKMTINQRYSLAKEIASDSIIPSMKMVLNTALGDSSSSIVASFLVGGITVLDNGKVNIDVPDKMIDSYDAICSEFRQVVFNGIKPEQKIGTLGQEIKSYEQLMTQYKNPVATTLEKATQNIMEMRNKALSNTKNSTLKY